MSSFTSRFALIATEVLNPFVLLAGVITWVSWLTDQHWMRTAGMAALFISVIPLGLTLLLTRLGKVTDKYILHRRQRHLFYALSLLSMIAGSVIVWLVPSSVEARWMTLMAVGTLLIVMVINTRVKISIHALVAALAAVVFPAGHFSPPILLAGMLIWAVTSWSRIYLNRHSITEVLYGSALGVIVGAVFLSVVGGLR